MKRQFLNKPLRILLYTNAMILTAGAMLNPIYAMFVEKVGGDLMDASLSGGIFALVAGLTTLISGKYADKIKENELIIVLGYIIMAFGFSLFFFVNSIVFLFIAQAIIGFGEAIYTPAFDAVYSKHLDDHKSGLEWGFWELINYFTKAIGAIIGGAIATLFGFKILFIVMSSLCIVSALYIFHLKRSVL